MIGQMDFIAKIRHVSHCGFDEDVLVADKADANNARWSSNALLALNEDPKPLPLAFYTNDRAKSCRGAAGRPLRCGPMKSPRTARRPPPY